MLARRTCQTYRRIVPHVRSSFVSRRSSSQAVEDAPQDLDIKLDLRLTALPTKKAQREPFVKNLFLGKFDTEILAYPEVQTNERQQQFLDWLKPIEDLMGNEQPQNEKISQEMLEKLQQYGVFNSLLDESWRGIGLSTTERAQLMEVVGSDPSLGAYLYTHVEPIEILLKYGREEQKNYYLPKFFNGELIPTMCIAEEMAGISPLSLGTGASMSECGKNWILNGTKTFVHNGNKANLFIVIANCMEKHDPLYNVNVPSFFIVESHHSGMSIEKTFPKVGQRGLESVKIKFTDTQIPKENILGKEGDGTDIMLHLLTHGKYNYGAQATAILKRFLKTVTDHIIKTQYFDRQLNSFHFVREIIAKITASLYTIESMTYLTTGLIDRFQDQDCSIENTIVQAYASKECVRQINEGCGLVGPAAYVKDSVYDKLHRDALALTLFNGITLDLNSYIAASGLHFLGARTCDVVRKYRNPFMFPKFMFTEVMFSKSVPDLALPEYLHPSLTMSAKLLESCVHKLSNASQKLLVTYGNKVTEQQMELKRLSEIASDCYAMTAVLARSSRSYCIGLRHSDRDIMITHSVCWNAYHRVEKNYTELIDGPVQNCDDLYQKIADDVCTNHGYFPEHPLKKNY